MTVDLAIVGAGVAGTHIAATMREGSPVVILLV
jgi:flavin-dependent dehydrogenase